MKTFELPVAEIIIFDVKDILTTSAPEETETMEPGELPGDDLE